MTKTALITGVTGQDGAYLAELLLDKGYAVHGIKRRSSLFNTDRVDHLYQDPHVDKQRFTLHYGDLTDSTNLIRIVQQVQPDEVYNLGAMSHVAVSFEQPEYTADADGIGTLRLLEAIRMLRLTKKTRFYQASTSELYGLVQEVPQKETTPFYPRSPYAVAKLYAYWITVNYREAYDMYACNGILFNHESPLRGETFVTRKITRAIRCRRRWPSGSWRSQGESARVPRLSGLAIRARRVRRDFDRSASTCRRTNFPSRLACASFSSAVLRKRSLSGAHCGIEDRCKGAARAPGVALRFIRRQGLESHIVASVWKPRCPRPDRRGRQEMAVRVSSPRSGIRSLGARSLLSLLATTTMPHRRDAPWVP